MPRIKPGENRGHGAVLQLNRVELIGYVGNNPQLVERVGNVPYVKFVLGVTVSLSEDYKFFDWHHIVVFPPYLVTYICKYVRTGDHIMVEGILRSRRRMVRPKTATSKGKFISETRVEIYSKNGRLIHMGIPKIFREDIRAAREKAVAGQLTDKEKREMVDAIVNSEEDEAASNVDFEDGVPPWEESSGAIPDAR